MGVFPAASIMLLSGHPLDSSIESVEGERLRSCCLRWTLWPRRPTNMSRFRWGGKGLVVVIRPLATFGAVQIA